MSRPAAPLVVHGSAVAFGGRGLLILGSSGAGKSGLALGLISRGARLVSDDRVVLTRDGKALIASAPEALKGLIEARGIGILRTTEVVVAAVEYVVDLDRAAAARMPQRAEITYLGLQIDLIFGRDIPNLEAALTFLMENVDAGF